MNKLGIQRPGAEDKLAPQPAPVPERRNSAEPRPREESIMIEDEMTTSASVRKLSEDTPGKAVKDDLEGSFCLPESDGFSLDFVRPQI